MAPWPAELLSPTPSAASLTATHTPEDIYYDPRDEPGPSRYVRAVVSQAGLGGVPARSTDGQHCAVACKDYLKILRITEPGSPASLGGEFARPPSRRPKLLATGAEGATIHDEITIRMGQNTLSTDVGWGHANNANKIVVTSRSGDILIVDAIKGKLERTIKEHTRSVNGVAFTPHLPNWFATCSQDGYVKLWDMRTNLDVSSVSINHRIATQCIAFSPSSSTRWHAIVALENGGFYKWDYKAKGVGLLDRYTAAHNGAILGMDWVGPSAGVESQGWLCTGGMDKTVKVWDMSQGLQEQRPPHVLHTAEKVKKLAWRPGHDCEVAIVPQTPGLAGRPGADGGETADADRIEIWDVRRPWLPKYVLEGGEGSVVGMVWAGPDVLWATYSNGSLVQHDLRECYRPLDSLPRSALAWDPSGAVTWATELVSSSEIPYDDVRPSLKPQLIHSGWKDKTPADSDYNAANQTIATATLPLFDTKGFVELARGYMLAPNPDAGEDVEARTLEQVCMVNAEVAHQAEYYRAAQTWLVLRSLLSPVTTHEIQDQERDELSASPSPIPVSPRTQGSSVARHAPTPPLPPLSGGRPPVRLHDRRSVSTSSVFQFQRPLPAVAAQLTAKSSDNSPASDNRRGYPIGNGAPPPPTNPLTRPTISRRSSTATKVSKSSGGRRKGSGSQDRRNYSKDRGRSASIGSPSRSRASSMAASKQIGDGALDDSSSEDDVPGVPEPRYIRHSSRSSLASNTLEVPDEEDERSLRSSSQTASSGSSMKRGVPPLLYFDDNSDDAGMMADDNYDSSTSSGRDSFKVPAPPSSPVASILLPLDRPKITKQDSRSSIRTAVPSNSRSRALSGAADRGRPQTSSSGNDTAGKTKPTADPYLTLGSSTDGELDGSTRRPSPASSGTERPRHLRTESYTGVSVIPTEEPILEVPSPHIHSHRLNSNSTSPHPSTEHTPLIRDVASLGHTERVPSYGTSSKFGIAATISDHEEDERGRSLLRKHQTQAPIDPVAVMEEEEKMRKIGWEAMREAFEYYREMGDVQMCTALATVARGELLSVEESATLDRLSSAYVDILTRLRLHTEAAYVRKHGASTDLRASTTVDTVVHAACGRCRKPLMKPSLAPTSSLVPESVASSTSSVTAFSHQRSLSRTRRDEASKRQNGKHSRHPSVVSASGTDQASGQPIDKSPELVEGGYGFCAKCRRASARCSICRLPVRGIHFFCPVCSHGGHHECYRNYYLKRPLMSPIRDDGASFGVPGSDGWGLAALSKQREPTKTETDDTDSLRSERRDSNPSDPEKVTGAPKEREREGSIVSGLTTSVASLASLGLGSSSGSKPEKPPGREKERETLTGRERERPRERETAKKRLMGHPCAAGCGHFCWMTNDPIEQV